MSKKIKYDLKIISPRAAQGTLRELYAQITHDLMQVPEPFTMHSPSVSALAAAWSIFRETLTAGQVNRSLKEAVATVVAQINSCPWCVEAHSIALYATGNAQVVSALAQHTSERLRSPQTQSIVDWASATRTPNAEILRKPPFTTEEMPEFIGTAVTFHYLTRMVNTLLVETSLPQGLLNTPLKRLLSIAFKQHANCVSPTGETSRFLPEAELPGEFSWAKSAPAIARAVSGFSVTMEAAATRLLPEESQTLVRQIVNKWCGEDPALSRTWVQDAVRPLKSEHQPGAILALLAALALR